jgi:serine/threonine-protein kinase
MYAAYVMSSLNVEASSGNTFGAYRLTELIGRGGMGEVWSAQHELLARPAAVKLIRHGPSVSKEERAARWRRFDKEAYATSLLTSPHTVTLYDYGVADDGTYYYAMELLEGKTLRAVVERVGALTAEQTITVGKQVCDSLTEAHARGIIHRDLKPENLFLARAGCDASFVKVLDFGLVTFLRGELKTYASDAVRSAIVGTPAYMSPEALFGGKVDERSDIYQLGCVLHFLLTGRPPFQGNNLIALALAQVRAQAPRASVSSPHYVPPALDEVIARCLVKEPAGRWGSAKELSAALDSALAALLVPDSGIVDRSWEPHDSASCGGTA